MRSDIHVATPPSKPLLLYDGDCKFCKFWIRRWQHHTGNTVDYAPFQDPQIGERFPEIPHAQLKSSVHLVEPNGHVFRGAEAVYRSLAHNSRWQWLLDWYSHSRVFSRISECSYERIAKHRTLFSFLTKIGWGKHSEPPTYEVTRWIFLRALGIIYLIAFASLATQMIGLIGADGIIPAKNVMANVAQNCDANGVGINRYHLFPTLCWFNASDAFLKVQCYAGIVLAMLAIVGIAPAPCLFLLWLIYLSLTTVGGDFLAFQWDNLLLETGFLAIFLAPWQWLPRRSSDESPAPRIVRLLLLWLLFRLMFESGIVKLTSGDPNWSNLTVLTFHYQTQPLPTPIAWYAHQLPIWFQKFSCGVMFAVELIAPSLLFGPRRLRFWAAGSIVVLEILIALTGNYTFFNWLSIALCLLAFDDAAFCRFLDFTKGLRRPRRFANKHETHEVLTVMPVSEDKRTEVRAPRNWPKSIIIPVACVVFVVTTAELLGVLRVWKTWPAPTVAVFEWLAPFRSFNNYGLFAVMTTTRPEIIVEGSDDGVNWRAYEFKYKPGDVTHRPRFVAPHQPRLDWQMWFAALSDYRHNPWFVNLCIRFLQGSPDVLALLKTNPFPDKPPEYVRAQLYDYRFTDFATRRKTGAWWERTLLGNYLLPISLRDIRQ